LSVLATAIVAVAFEPVRIRVQRTFSRALHQDRTSPYQVLAHFPKTVTGSYPAEELPARMAKVLTEGTRATRAEVWLAVHGRLELAASWPPDPTAAMIPAGFDDDLATGRNTMATADCAATAPPVLGLERPDSAPMIVVEGLRHSLAVRERGELLGALTVVARAGQQLTPVEERLFAGLAAQSGLMLRVAGLRAELEQQLAALDKRTQELRMARRDLVTRQDAERQRLERNIHDGAQQEVIALLVNLRLTQTLLARAPERGARLLSEQGAAARSTIETLTALSLGLYPRLLTDAGPVAALAAAVSSGPIPVDLTSSDVPRCPPDVEAAVYFSCLEAVQNASKHSRAARITIEISGRFGDDGIGEIALTVTDDGDGFDPACRTGNGLLNICDRIECVRGTVSINSRPGQGTSITARIPTLADQSDNGATAADQTRVLSGVPAAGG
jgi:signal transduction histidine kinase